MTFWEFLLQKDGDRSWLPLESPTVEILEGRYRVVGRSSRVNTKIEIRIAHDALTEAIPVRRTQKRSGCTNQDGLVVIMPFTQLQPGDWELYCTGDLMADMMGEGWQYGVKLQVLPAVQDAETWESDPHMPMAVPHFDPVNAQREKLAQTAASLAIVSRAEGASVGIPSEKPAVAASQPSLVEIDLPQRDLPQRDLPQRDSLQKGSLQTDSPQTDSPQADLLQTNSPQTGLSGNGFNGSATVYLPEDFAPEVVQPETLPPLLVTTEQEMYVVRRGKPLMLRGEIRSLETAEDLRKMPFQLRVRLFAPQNAQVLFDMAYPLDPAALPIPFTCAVPLPHHYETYLMLGEVAVELPSSDNAFSAATVVSQSFKVTTDLHELLESIANSFSDQPDVLPPLEALSLPSEHPRFNQSDALPTVQFQPAQSVLPPQLRSAPPENGDAAKDRRAIELPIFAPEVAQEVTVPEPLAADLSGNEAGTAIGSPGTSSEPKTLIDLPLTHASPALESEQSVSEQSASQGLAQEFTQGFTQGQPTAANPTANPGASPEVGVARRGTAPSQGNSVPPKPPEVPLPQANPSGRLPKGGKTFTSPQSSPPILADTDPEDDWRYAAPQKPRRTSPDSPLAPEDIAFRSLNLQQRFLSRLQSLATDGQPSGSNAGNPRPASGSDPNHSAIQKNQAQQPIGEDAHLAYDEFVIDEGWEEMAAMQDRFPPGRTGKQSSSQKSWSSAQQPAQTPGLTLPPDEPLPVPMLHLPLENLLSGTSVLVLVKLPDCPAKLAVKLWLIDRQSRLLLDGPHWLTDFTPDGFGQWMSRMELLLPQGYLDVQIEAISVEIMTQRESEKATEARSVQLPFSQFDYDAIDVENL